MGNFPVEKIFYANEKDTTEINSERLAKFENKLKEICKSCLTKNEKESNQIILDNKEKAKSFAETLALSKYPNLSKPIRIKCSEDKTSNFWFLIVHVCPTENCFGGELELIVYKKNCKVIWYYQTS